MTQSEQDKLDELTEFEEPMAKAIFERAIKDHRAAELLSRLFDGAAVTLDAQTGALVFMSKEQIDKWINPLDVSEPTVEEILRWLNSQPLAGDYEGNVRRCTKCQGVIYRADYDTEPKRHFLGQCQPVPASEGAEKSNRLHRKTVAMIEQIEATMLGGAHITPSLLFTYRQLIRREFEQEPAPIIADSPPKPFIKAGAYKNSWPGKAADRIDGVVKPTGIEDGSLKGNPDSGTELSLSLLVVDFGKKCVTK